jgi:hypothetical protein
MDEGERARNILSQHLGLEPARKVSTDIEDRGRELAKAGQLKEYTQEELAVMLEELREEMKKTSRKKWMKI